MKKKKLMLTLACSAVVLASGLSLIACGENKQVLDKAGYDNCLQSNQLVTKFEKGYRAVEFLDGKKYDIKFYAEDLEQAKSKTDVYVEASGDYQFESTTYVNGDESFLYSNGTLKKQQNYSAQYLTTPIVDASQIWETYFEYDQDFAVTQTTNGDNITLSYSGDYTMPSEQQTVYDVKVQILFSGKALKSFSVQGQSQADSNSFAVTYEDYNQEIDFSGVDFSTYSEDITKSQFETEVGQKFNLGQFKFVGTATGDLKGDGFDYTQTRTLLYKTVQGGIEASIKTQVVKDGQAAGQTEEIYVKDDNVYYDEEGDPLYESLDTYLDGALKQEFQSYTEGMFAAVSAFMENVETVVKSVDNTSTTYTFDFDFNRMQDAGQTQVQVNQAGSCTIVFENGALKSVEITYVEITTNLEGEDSTTLNKTTTMTSYQGEVDFPENEDWQSDYSEKMFF